MTKKVRIENADTSNFRIVVQVWEKKVRWPEQTPEPDTMVKEIELSYPTMMTGDDCYITSSRYLVVKELEPKP